jgi:hypothetical protein
MYQRVPKKDDQNEALIGVLGMALDFGYSLHKNTVEQLISINLFLISRLCNPYVCSLVGQETLVACTFGGFGPDTTGLPLPFIPHNARGK